MKKIFVLLVIGALMLSLVACGMTPREKLIDALENGEVIDYSKPFTTDFEIKIDRFKMDFMQDTFEDEQAMSIINQLEGSKIKFTVNEDVNNRKTSIHAEGTLFQTPFALDAFFTEDQYIIKIEEAKQLINKIEELSGESLGIPFDQLNTYLYGSYSSVNDGLAYDVEEFFTDLDSLLVNYRDYQQLGNKLAVAFINKIDEKYFKNEGDYVVLSLNEESIKEIITKVLDDFEKDPQGTINGLFDAVDEFYPAIEQMAANQDSYSDVPTYEEFKEELDLQRNQALELVSSEEQVKQLRNTIDQAINTFTSFIKINAYDTGYEIDDGNIVGSKSKMDLTMNQSFIIPVSLDMSLTALTHFEKMDKDIEIPELTNENSTDLDNFMF